jgi:hypothetical protein
MGFKNWYNHQDLVIKGAVVTASITGALGVIAAIVIGGSSIINAVIDHSSSTPSSRQSGVDRSKGSSSTQQPVVSCSRSLTFTYPPNGLVISDGGSGVKIRGTVCNLGNDYAWLFEWDSQDRYYYADYNGSGPSPLALPPHGVWSFTDKPIGDQGDDQKEYLLTLVLASPSCNQELLQTQSIINNGRILQFPNGCQIVDQREVFVTYPQ